MGCHLFINMPRSYKPKKKVYKSVRPTKETRVLETIKDYYIGLKISERVNDIPVDPVRYKMFFKRNEDYINSIYDKYNMVRYYDIYEFKKGKEAYGLTDKQVEALWKQYEHRDKLIRTGQYDEYRIELFRDNYIKGMRRLGASDKEIETLQNLPLAQWDLMQDVPQPNKDNIKDKILPQLGLFNYNDASYLGEVRKALKLLLKDNFGVDYTWDDSSIIGKSLKYSKKLIGDMDKLSEQEFDDMNEVEQYTYMISHVKDSKLKESKPDKNGVTHWYIRGIGSEIGKNSQLIKDIAKAKGKKII